MWSLLVTVVYVAILTHPSDGRCFNSKYAKMEWDGCSSVDTKCNEWEDEQDNSKRDLTNLEAVCKLYDCNWSNEQDSWEDMKPRCKHKIAGNTGKYPDCTKINDGATCKQENGGLNNVFCLWITDALYHFHYDQYIAMNAFDFNKGIDEKPTIKRFMEEQSLLAWSGTTGKVKIEAIPLLPELLKKDTESLKQLVQAQTLKVEDAKSVNKYTVVTNEEINAMSGILASYTGEAWRHTQMTFIDDNHEWLVGCAHGVTNMPRMDRNSEIIEEHNLQQKVIVPDLNTRKDLFFLPIDAMYFVPSSEINGKTWKEIEASKKRREVMTVYVPNGYFLTKMGYTGHLKIDPISGPTDEFIRNWDVSFVQLKPLDTKPKEALKHAMLGYLANNNGKYTISTFSYPKKMIVDFDKNKWEMYQYDASIDNLYEHIIRSAVDQNNEKEKKHINDIEGGQSGMTALLKQSDNKYYVYGVYSGVLKATLPGYYFCRISYYVERLMKSMLQSISDVQVVPKLAQSVSDAIVNGQEIKAKQQKQKSFPKPWPTPRLKKWCDKYGRNAVGIVHKQRLIALKIPESQHKICVAEMRKYDSKIKYVQ